MDQFKTNFLRIKNQDELIVLLSEHFLSRSALEWIKIFDKNGIPAGMINTVPEALGDPSINERKLIFKLPHKQSATGQIPMVGCPIKFSQSEMSYKLPPPILGEHSEEILLSLGYSVLEINALKHQNVIS